MKKRVISIILVFTMLLGLLPSALAGDEATKPIEEHEYIFRRDVVDTATRPELLNSSGKLLAATMADMELTDIREELSAPWRPASHNYITGAEVKADSMYWKTGRSPTGKLVCYAIELDVKNGGEYVPSITYTKKKNSPIVDVYLVKEGTIFNKKSTADFNFASVTGTSTSQRDGDIYTFVGGDDDKKRPEEYKLGTLDLYSASEITETTAFPLQTLDGNSKYYLIFHTVNKNASCAKVSDIYEFSISSFKLGGPVLEELSISCEKTYLLLDDVAGMSLSISGKMTGGKAADFSDANITYKSSDESVATVDGNGRIMPVARGNVKITATVSKGGVTLTKSVLIAVTSAPVAPSFEISADSAETEENGDYKVSFTTGEKGYYDVAINSKNKAETAKVYVDGKYVGESDGSEERKLARSIELLPGSHTLIIRCGSTDRELHIESVEFMSTEELCGISEVKIELTPERLFVGESAYCRVKIVQKNGAEYYAPIVFADGSIEAAFEVTNQSNAVSLENGVVKALTFGSAQLSVFERFNGFELSGSASITVEPEPAFEEYKYVFRRDAVDTETRPELLNSSGRLLAATMADMELADIREELSAPWRPASHNYITGAEVKASSMYWKNDRNPAEMSVCYAIELYVKNKGSYVPRITYTKQSSSPIVDVYLVKEGTVFNKKSTADFNFTSVTGTKTSQRDGDIYTFVGGAGEGTRPEAHKLGTLDLYSASETSETTIFSTQTLDRDSKYYLIFHTVGENEKCKKNNGIYEISVESFKLGGPVLSELSLSCEKAYILVDDTDGIQMSLSGKMTDGAVADLSNAEITYRSSDESVATVDANGRVMSVSRGNAKITAAVSMDEVTLIKSVLIAVTSAPVAHGFELFSASAEEEENGDYEISFTTEEKGYYDVAINSENKAETAKVYVDGKYVGESDGSEERLLGRSIELLPGSHTLVIRRGNMDSELHIESVEFMSTEELCGIGNVEIELEPERLAPGESADYRVKIVQKNGAKYYAPIVSADGSIEAAFEVTSPDETVSFENGVIKALTAGVAKLSVYENFNSFELSGSAGITVDDVTYTEAELGLDENVIYFVGSQKEISAFAVLSDGRRAAERDVIVGEFTSSNESVVKIENGTMTVVGEGEATVTASVTFNNIKKIASKTIRAEKIKLSSITAKTEDNVLFLLDGDGSYLITTGINNDGSAVDITGASFTYENLTPEIISVEEDGCVKAISRGNGKVKITADVFGQVFSCIADVVSGSSKTESTIYTYEMRENALENVKKYSWAKSMQKSAVKKADKWVENLDRLYELMPGEGLPRSFAIGTLDSPTVATETIPAMQYNCPYDGTDIRKNHGAYSWGVDPLTRPWKVQCPECKRLFPSNDFGSFYELGLNKANGVFSRATALQRHRELFGDLTIEEPGELGSEQWKAYYGYGNKDGYLYNSMYSDKDSTWMVDDGFGWSPRDGVPGSDEKVTKNPKWCPIAYYMHRVWRLQSNDNAYIYVLQDLTNAYLYTGDPKYGRAGAIILDRVADLYPEFDLIKTSLSYPNSHGSGYSGKILGSIWECILTEQFIKSYDAFYPMMEDSEVIKYLSAKATEYGMANPKTSGELIRENAENGIVREVIKALLTGRITGNFGKHQMVAACAAVALDTYPESDEVFNWLCAPSVMTTNRVKDPIYQSTTRSSFSKNTGGELLLKYINDVDRDGFGNETAIGYNSGWVSDVIDIALLFARYDKETPIDLLDNPKYIKMLNSIIKETVGNGYSLQLGDSGATAGKGVESTADETLKALSLLPEDNEHRIQIAKNYYWSVGGDIEDIHVDIFTDNSSLTGKIREIIEKHGELEFESENLTGFGLALLRQGELVKMVGAAADVDYRGDLWMYYGRTNSSHAHRDMLAIGIDAYGFNFMPDLGYPEATSYDENRHQWVKNTLSHNTVVVNDEMQKGIYTGKPLHYDRTDKVGLVDVDGTGVYSGVDIYRRTAVSVAASDEVSYTVDFFRIKGGNKHTYSFHTQSHDGFSSDDLNFVPQLDENGKDGMYDSTGAYRKYTYAGIGETYIDEKGKEQPVLYGPDPDGSNTTSDYVTRYPRGYTWLTNVNLADNVAGGNFSVNFKQTDFKKQVDDSADLNLKFTALNDWAPSEVAITTGYAPRTSGNNRVTGLDYMFIHREGKNLDTLYTSVLQPYKGEEYIESMTSIALTANGKQVTGNNAKAVKITLKNGRCDYIVYSTVDNVTYSVSDTIGENVPVSFSFRGFVGVYSVNEKGENVYSYINDGDIIGGVSAVSAYTGEVVSFTSELTDKNIITVQMDGEVDINALKGRYIYVENDGKQSGAYRILEASVNEENTRYTDLYLGNTSLIRSFKNNDNLDAGYVYNIENGQNFTIPLSYVDDFAPEFDDVSGNLTTSAGSTITVKVNAQSPNGETITYDGKVLPRGASIVPATGMVTWKPDASQVGESGFMITAHDESGRESSVTFEITVYGSTTGDKNVKEETPSAGDSGASAAGGGGGGGDGATPTDKPDDETKTGENDNGDASGDTEGGESASDASGEKDVIRFTDLSNHAWAADAINTLADDGIIRGTTSDTYSPAKNITRADFASLLVRAFELSSDSPENFEDVQSGDYFAPELAIARNTGIVNGIGGNKFAPRNTITRQDMMVIVYRAMQKRGVGFGVYDKPQYTDFPAVAPYAQDAVSALISAGLVNGKSGCIAPTDYTTRAEVAVLIKRIMDYTEVGNS